MKKKLLSILLAASMLLIPATAFAEEGQPAADTTGNTAAEAVQADPAPAQATDNTQADPAAAQAAENAQTDPAAVPAAENAQTDPTAAPAAENAQTDPAAAPAADTAQDEWKEGWNKERTQYKNENGEIVKGLFKAMQSNSIGALFYADKDGYVVKTPGLITVNYPDVRYLRISDAEGSTGFAKVGDTDSNSYTYLIGEKGEGAIVEKPTTFKTSKGTVIVQENGTVLTKQGFVDVDGVRRYVTTKGYMKTKAGWVRLNGKKYRVSSKGIVRTKVGAFTVDGVRYVIPNSSNDGALAATRGVYKAKDWLYFVKNTKGQLGKNLAYKIGSKVYHVNSNGTVKVGKHKWKDGKYYFSTQKGYLRTKAGLMTRNGKRFLVRKGGQVVVSQKVKYKGNFYIANKYGTIKTGLFKWKGDLYYASDKGVLKSKAGIIQYQGNDYFVWGGGVVAVSKMFYWGGKLYAADENGHLLTGLFRKGNSYYFADADHSVRTSEGVLTNNGSYYYNKKGGGLARNQWVEYGGKHYYAGDNAAFRTGTFTISGVTFHASNTGVISDEEYKKLFPDPADDEGDDVEDVD